VSSGDGTPPEPGRPTIDGQFDGQSTGHTPADGWTRPRVNKQVLARKRVPYFHRPKHPRDWRWWVGGVGRILIATGLLMFAFVGYQLWGTGIQTAQAQNNLEDQFNDLLSATTTTTAVAAPSTSVDPEASSTTSTIPMAVDRNLPNGTVLGKLQIPKIGLDWYYVEGVGLGDLKKGPGHFKETPMPGQLGNAAIAGHRTTYGHPFYKLNDLQPGDLVTTITLDGTFVYQVTDKLIVKPADYGKVIPTRNPDIATLTLATCHPVYTARERLIVIATLVADQSDPVKRPPATTGSGEPEALPGEWLPGEETPDATASTTATMNTSDTSEPTVGSTTAPISAVPTTTLVATTENDAEIDDTFSEGWFSDAAAWPHVIGWGTVLALVAVGAYFAGRAVKRLYVCFLVGALPFVFVLYFFFENVNRLLPPGL
jgi:sortase A